MSKSNAHQVWINAGYALFAQEGYDGIQIERLARIVGLNKSGFYHYFGDRDSYFQLLMQQHLQNADSLLAALPSIRSFVPQYIQFLDSFPTQVLVHMQLVRENHHPLFAYTFEEVNKKIDKAILPLWAEFIGLPDNRDLAFRFFELFRDMFYARLNKHNLNFEMMYSICMEAKDICHEFRNSHRGNTLTATPA